MLDLVRPSRVVTYMELAAVWAKRSTCHRLNVGAVIVVDRTVVSHGYNGTPPGHTHCLGNDCPGKLECRETVHAEDNAIRRLLPGLRNITVPKDMYCTDSPCPSCAEKIYQAGVHRVFFAQPYRITDSLDWLDSKGVRVFRVTPAGYVVNWMTKDVVEVQT